jgi:hypothetical protein
MPAARFEEERYQYAPASKQMREALAVLDPKPKPEPLPPRKPCVPSSVLQKKRHR